ncbi:uncharacterized protein LOC111350703 [Spodoptera litura]|uniref:Uncharacterized protein LOC111350703 n=1 Tax=Spodoptera litura TaxID=69820 RepID=A0A9J7DXK0_SPOLT|nr:uncharacterized protein LOC111350703 [Spodoptera litura]
MLGNIDGAFAFTGKSAVDLSTGVLRGRPYGGVALLWRSAVFPKVVVIPCSSVRIAAIKIMRENRSLLVITVYMPTNSNDNLCEFTECLSELNAIIEGNDVNSVIILGDFNAHPGKLFHSELLSFCTEQSWSCVDTELLPNDTYTYVCGASGSHSWLDHCVVTTAARSAILSASVLNSDVYWSDHYPLLLVCNFNAIRSSCQQPTKTSNISRNSVKWGERNTNQIDKYHRICNSKLKLIDFPPEFQCCADGMCNIDEHKFLLDDMYNKIINILTRAAKASYSLPKRNNYRYVTGWNRYVSDAHRRARFCFQTWVSAGKPKSGDLYIRMCESRKMFKSRLASCQKNEKQIKMNIIAENHFNKDFSSFWKNTKKLSPGSGLPASVGGEHDPHDIACAFRRHFRVESPLGPASGVPAAENLITAISVRCNAKTIANIINKMVRGKSPGHDDLSIEHLKYAGIHLPRVLSMFFSLCIGHSYLPERLMYTTVVPILKNKTGDSSDLSNYRPISLATVIAKVLDSLLDKQLEEHLQLHDAQFGFRPGLSTEDAILCLKQTVQYYTDRGTPVYACYLDLSKAFDLVCYDKLWQKLESDTEVPREVISLLRFWYANQRNRVRWAGAHSDVYGLECGVRQGGISSPHLFNLYMNRLIGELSNTGIGCSIDGVSINNISYADDMVLLSPSIAALRKLMCICQSYAEAHGLRYNANKSEFMVFKSRSKCYSHVPHVTLCGMRLKKVSAFKYLGHWVTEDLCDNEDIERERRALSIRCNMLARRFARCTTQVKITLFKAYCQTFYTCSLWTNFALRGYSALRVQYNNAFRILLGLPRFCSASAMFAEAQTDDFFAIIRKRCASLLRRVRGSPNGILSTLSQRWDSPMLMRWMRLHASGPSYL